MQKILIAHGLPHDEKTFRDEEIALHNAIEEIENNELLERMSYFIQTSDLAGVQKVLEITGNPNAKNRDSQTALCTAIILVNFEIAQYLLEHGADATQKILKELLFLCMQQNEEIAK